MDWRAFPGSTPCAVPKAASTYHQEAQEFSIHSTHNRSARAATHIAAIACAISFCGSFAHAAPHVKPSLAAASPCQVVVVGYTGGLETATTSASGVVWIRDRLRTLKVPNLCVHTFSAYNWPHGYRWVRQQFGAQDDAQLTPDAIRNGPKVVIYGHSFGGWATVSLARRLQRAGIPIEMTVQVDSIGITDRTLPPNVRESANFYERNTEILHARGTIHAQDPLRTRILENVHLLHGNHYTVSRNPQISDLIVGKVLALYGAPE